MTDANTDFSLDENGEHLFAGSVARLNIACTTAKLETALERLGEAVGEL